MGLRVVTSVTKANGDREVLSDSNIPIDWMEDGSLVIISFKEPMTFTPEDQLYIAINPQKD